MDTRRVTVVSVEIIEEECEVYDVEVEQDHSFVVGNVVLHNSKICIALDGRVWKYDDPSGRIPPAHPNCRSTTRALIRGADVTLGDQKKPASMRGYGEWLSTQTQTVQNEILGPTRAGFWRDGKMTLADAIDGDLRVLTLKQLRAKLGLDAVVHA